MNTYTVIGFWDEGNERVVVGVVEGNHTVSGGESVSEYGPFAVTVEATSADAAEIAVANDTDDVL